jgi:hypothetical protein
MPQKLLPRPPSAAYGGTSPTVGEERHARIETAYARAACDTPSNIRLALLRPPEIAGGLDTISVSVSTRMVITITEHVIPAGAGIQGPTHRAVDRSADRRKPTRQ